uniref:Uncharacterized protein n=1 Tax=Onchocerca volvulus TaxID=6282 RepID=A0A8R1TLT4_ONCVO
MKNKLIAVIKRWILAFLSSKCFVRKYSRFFIYEDC